MLPPQPTSPVGPEALRRTLASFPTGIVLVTGQDYNSTPVGMLANSFTSVSLDPPLVSLAFARSSSTWPLLRYASLLRISVLGTQLAGPTAQRFVGLECALRGEDAALLGSPATLSAVPERIIEAGDHDLALLRVLEVEQDGEIGPLVLYARRLHRLAI